MNIKYLIVKIEVFECEPGSVSYEGEFDDINIAIAEHKRLEATNDHDCHEWYEITVNYGQDG